MPDRGRLPLAVVWVGLLVVLAWIGLVPLSATASKEWAIPLVVMILFALVLVIAVSATFLIDSRWPNVISALSKLRPGLLVVLTSGLVVVGSLGVLVWWAWVGTPPCFTTGPVVSDPGFCPPLPTAAEIWTVFVVTLLVILIPCGLLVMAYLRQAPERPPPTAV